MRDLHRRTGVFTTAISDREIITVERDDGESRRPALGFADGTRGDINIPRIVRHLAVVRVAGEVGKNGPRLHDFAPLLHAGTTQKVLQNLERIVMLKDDDTLSPRHGG